MAWYVMFWYGMVWCVCRMYPVIFFPCMLLHALYRTTPLPHPSLPTASSSGSLLTEPLVARLLWPSTSAPIKHSASADHLIAVQHQQHQVSTAPLSGSGKRPERARIRHHILNALNRLLVRWRIAPLKYAQLSNAFRWRLALSLSGMVALRLRV
jgi:hypothetical protein